MITQAVFFDLDGTLIDTAPDMGGALNLVLAAHGRTPVSEAQYRPLVSHGSIALLQLGFPELDPRTDMADLREEFLTTYEQNIYHQSKLFDGVEELLKSLEDRALPWGIITNKPDYLTNSLLQQMQLTERCCSIIGADTAAHAKPHPAPMLMACEQARVTPSACLYIGDAERDIQAGRAVGMKSLVAGWGYIDPQHDDPHSWHADAILELPADIIKHISTDL